MLRRTTIGSGRIDMEDEYVRLVLRPTSEHDLALAQLDDHHPLDSASERFSHHPPVRVSLYARASLASPGGSFGFGFWNDPFSTTGESLAAPRCIWFDSASSSTQGFERALKAGVWNINGRDEVALDDINVSDWRRYEIDWLAEAASFRVDGVERFRVSAPPPGLLGFAVWISNRVFSVPQEGNAAAKLRRIDSEQWLEVKSLKIERPLEIRNL